MTQRIDITSRRLLAISVLAITFGIAADLNSSVVPSAVTALLIGSMVWHVHLLYKTHNTDV